MWETLRNPQHDDQRILTAHRGDFEKVFFNDIGNLMVSEDMFELFMPGCINYKSMALAFALLSKLAGGLFHLIFSVYRGFPYMLFRLLSSSIEEAKAFAREFEAMPYCRLDKFSRQFRALYPTVSQMLSSAARATLLLLAFIMHCDTALIECGHALVNKMRRPAGQTWDEFFEVTSANLLLARQRLIETSTSLTQPRPSAGLITEAMAGMCQRVAQGTQAQGRRHEQGGPWRVFVSEWLRERHCNNEAPMLKECAQEYRKHREAGGDRWASLVAQGTLAARHTGPSGPLYGPLRTPQLQRTMQAIDTATAQVRTPDDGNSADVALALCKTKAEKVREEKEVELQQYKARQKAAARSLQELQLSIFTN